MIPFTEQERITMKQTSAIIFIAELADKIRNHTYRFTSESELQTQIASALKGVPLEKEFRLSNRDRVDFLASWEIRPDFITAITITIRIGIEIKIGGGISDVTRQLHRYAGNDQIDGLILVTSKLQLANLPKTLRGKPLRVIPLLESIL